MIDFQQLADCLQLCAGGELSLDEFEDWFESASWNVHQSADAKLIGSVFGIEALLSAFYDGRLDREGIAAEFRHRAKAMERDWMTKSTSPFPCAILDATVGVPVQAVSRTATTMSHYDLAGSRWATVAADLWSPAAPVTA